MLRNILIQKKVVASILLLFSIYYVYADPAPNYPEYAYGIPSGTDLKSILNKPAMVSAEFTVFTDDESGEKRIGGVGDVHAVYDLPMEQLYSVCSDIESFPNYVPRNLKSTILEKKGLEYIVIYETGIKFLAFSNVYTTRCMTKKEILSSTSRGYRSWNLESIDGSSYAGYNSVYMEEVFVNGKKMTYVRYFNHIGLRKPSGLVIAGLHLFIEPETKAQINAIYKETKKRYK